MLNIIYWKYAKYYYLKQAQRLASYIMGKLQLYYKPKGQFLEMLPLKAKHKKRDQNLN